MRENTFEPPFNSAPGVRRAIRILVVEDNADAGEMLKELLEFDGYTVALAASGQEAVQRAPGFAPHVVLCDIGLPGMDGYQVARAFRAHGALAGAELVAITGYGQDEDRTRARDAGFDRHLTKPVNPSELETLLAGIERRVAAA